MKKIESRAIAMSSHDFARVFLEYYAFDFSKLYSRFGVKLHSNGDHLIIQCANRFIDETFDNIKIKIKKFNAMLENS